MLFNGTNSSGVAGLWVTDGASADTRELTGIRGAAAAGLNPSSFVVLKNEALFNGVNGAGVHGLWVTNGDAQATQELTPLAGALTTGLGLNPYDLTVFGSEVLFGGTNASNHIGLWASDGTTNTEEIKASRGPVLRGFIPPTSRFLAPRRCSAAPTPAEIQACG